MTSSDELYRGYRLRANPIDRLGWQVRFAPEPLMIMPWPDPPDLPIGSTREEALCVARHRIDAILKDKTTTKDCCSGITDRTYRFYVMKGHVRLAPSERNFPTDEAALDFAKTFAFAHAECEVWDGRRLVGVAVRDNIGGIGT